MTWSLTVPAGGPDATMAEQLAEARAKWEREWPAEAVEKYRGDVAVAAGALLELTGPKRTGWSAYLSGWHNDAGGVQVSITANPAPPPAPAPGD